ncbi:MAG: CusA/CzcA family heavy metal efflux RND transporter [Candidatus Kapabacteria bacterium]|nr:CusA/CzcA family heavy metal efflux RND transporter [Candidatus Kapabacteria bacterium]
MINQFVKFSLQQRALIISLAVVLIVAGFWAYSQLKVEAYPDVSDTNIVVITKFNGRAAEEVEQQITLPLERALNAMPHVIIKRSKSIFGLSVITITFDDKVDEYFASQLVFQKLKEAELPPDVDPQIGPVPNPVGEIFRYVLTAPPNISSMELRTAQDWIVIPKMLQAQGVADVVTFGGLVKQYHVIINPQKLQDYGLTISNLIDKIHDNNINTGGNILERGSQAIAIRGIGAVKSKSEIENIVLMSRKGVPVLLRDVAAVDIGAMPPSGVLGYTIPDEKTDNPNAVQGLVLMRKRENPSDVLINIKKQIEEINKILPNNIKIKPILDRQELVNNTVATVSRTLMEGVIIVVIVLFFFLGNVRIALISSICIPLSLLFAFILMYFSNIPANLLSLGAIDFGIIVDGAVIMVENIMYKLKHRDEYPQYEGHTNLYVIRDAAHEVEKQIFFSVAIIILAYIPLFSLQRVEGKLFSPMAFTLSFAILGSLILSLSVIPVIISFVFKGKINEWENPIAKLINKIYFKIIPKVYDYRIGFVVLAAIIIGIAFYSTKYMGTEFLPELDEGSFNIRTQLATGMNLQTSTEIANSIRKDLSEFPEINCIVSQTGRNEDGTDPYGPNRIETLITLKDYNSWKSGKSKNQLAEEIQKKLEIKYPGAVFTFSQPIIDNVSEAVTGSVADLAVIVTGPDLDKLRSICDSIADVIRPITGASETSIEQEGPQSQLIIKVDRDKSARYGVPVVDVQSLVEAALGGKEVSNSYEEEKKFAIVVRYPLEMRSTVDDIGNLIITNSNGEKIPLSSLAQIEYQDGATLIARQNGSRLVSVRSEIVGRDQGGFVAEAREKVEEKIKLPSGYKITWGGQFENLSRASARLAIVIPITVVIISILLFVLFKKVKYTLIVLTNVLFGLVGGIAALLIRGMHFNVSAGVGFISLFGVSVMSGVLLVSKINQLRFQYGYEFRQAVLEGAKMQLRPIMMMMTVAMLGLIPAAKAIGIGSDVQKPLATVIVGGLATAMVLSLIALPGLYALIERKAKVIVEEEEPKVNY